MAWLTGQFGPASLMPDTEAAERAMALRDRIHVAAEPSYRVEQATVTVTLADGREISTFVDGYTGSAANPMTDAQLEAKLIHASRGTRFEQRADAIIRAVWGIDDGRSAADVIALLHD
jgi:2-methylcitrate dehydratase PrpD